MAEKILLDNVGAVGREVSEPYCDMYFPRLQINKRGEIVLSLRKEGTLTSGILIAMAEGCETELNIGQYLQDWEVVGELKDYDGEVTVTFQNLKKTV